MAFLSRFRRTVLPSPRNKKLTASADDDFHHYNYRKSTKSFNEKSVKLKNSQMCADSYDDNINNDAKEKPTKNSRNNKIYVSTLTTNKSTKNKTDNSLSVGGLSRSNTFTLEDEEYFQQNGTYPRIKMENPNAGQYRERNSTDIIEGKNGKPHV